MTEDPQKSGREPPEGFPWSADMRKYAGTFNELAANYGRESDRAAVVLAVSLLDFKLGEALQDVLVDDELARKKFEHGMFGSFHNRIELAYCLGHLSKSLRKDFHTLRDLRNHFAHQPTHADLGDAEAIKLCAKLELAEHLRESGSDLRTICLVAVASCLFAVAFHVRTDTRPVVPVPHPDAL